MGCFHSKPKKTSAAALRPRPVHTISASSSKYSVASVPSSPVTYRTWYNPHTGKRHNGQNAADFADCSGVHLKDCTCENCWEYRARHSIPQPPRPTSRYAVLNKDDPKAPYRVPAHVKFNIGPHPHQMEDPTRNMPGAW